MAQSLNRPPLTQIPPSADTTTPQNPLLAPGTLSLLVGDPGTGKSLLAIDLAARLSQGTRLPILNPPRLRPFHAEALLLSLEDSQATLQSRLLAAHADPLRFHLLPGTFDLIPPTYGYPKAWLRAQTDPQPSSLLAALADFLPTLQKFRLLILDPLPAFLGVYDCSHQGTIRRLLRPLLQLAEERQFSILGISHLAKTTKHSKNPLHHIIGSLGYTALARTILLLTHDTLTHNPARRLVVPIKNNAGPLQEAYAFNIQNPEPEPDDASAENASPNDPLPITNYQLPHSSPPLHWESTPLPSHPLLNQSSPEVEPPSPQLESALHLIRTMLSDGPLPSAELYRSATSLGLSRSTVNRARELLKTTFKYNGRKREWIISLAT